MSPKAKLVRQISTTLADLFMPLLALWQPIHDR
jgi:hypothetical protein